MWNVATASLRPNETNVYCFVLAQQWKVKNNSPFESAVDKAKERSKSGASERTTKKQVSR